MALTSSQKTQLKAYMDADPTFVDMTPSQAAARLNMFLASFYVWRTLIPIREVGETFDAAELAGLTALNHTRLQTLAIYLSSGVNAFKEDVRRFFDDVFSGAGGANTRVALSNLWKRLAREGEKVFANTSGGSGTNATPALLTFEGEITPIDVEEARNS